MSIASGKLISFNIKSPFFVDEILLGFAHSIYGDNENDLILSETEIQIYTGSYEDWKTSPLRDIKK
jgi:hypothetical protein